MKILIACEESQIVCKAFRALGHEAFSCDLLDCSGGHPEWHIKEDALIVVHRELWDMMIAFPPCTHLAVSGAKWFNLKRKDGRQKQAIDFFMALVNAPISRIAIENPIGIMSSIYRKPDQIIQPYFFGDAAQKTTCLWLKNLPPLYHNRTINLFDDTVTHTVPGKFFEWIDSRTGKIKRQPLWYKRAWNLKPDERSKLRSRTFPGIANAMAAQWGKLPMPS